MDQPLQSTGALVPDEMMPNVALEHVGSVLEDARLHLARKTLEYCFLQAESGKTYLVDKTTLVERKNAVLKAESYVRYLQSVYDFLDLEGALPEEDHEELTS